MIKLVCQGRFGADTGKPDLRFETLHETDGGTPVVAGQTGIMAKRKFSFLWTFFVIAFLLFFFFSLNSYDFASYSYFRCMSVFSTFTIINAYMKHQRREAMWICSRRCFLLIYFLLINKSSIYTWVCWLNVDAGRHSANQVQILDETFVFHFVLILL